MKTILVPLDGSALAEQVLPYVRLLAPLLDARVRLIQAIDEVGDRIFTNPLADTYGHDPLAAPWERQEQPLDRLRQCAEGYLENHALALRAEGLDAEAEVIVGHAAEAIVEVARREHVAMVAMATHGYSGLKRWALGSVADKVVHAACAPVLVVRGGAVPPPALGRILVPLDGSALANQALPLASELARCAQAELVVMQAVPAAIEAYPGLRPLGRPLPQYGDVLAALRRQATQDLAAVVNQLRQRELAACTVVANGHAAETIIDQATQRHTDLIVMATHGYGGLKRWALGSVADKVLHATATPLLLVRAR
jgi:nucleotide-binding universal stress UspA family protein